MNRIFRETFAMEKMLAGAIAFHKDMLVAKHYVAPPSRAAAPARVSVIVRALGRTPEAIERTLASLAAQTCSTITALLVTDEHDAADEVVRRHRGTLDVRVIAPPAGSRGAGLWAGLTQVGEGYFALLDAGGEYYPNHLALLLERIDYFQRVKSRTVRIVHSGSVRRSELRDLVEREPWRDNANLPGAHYMRIESFGALGSHAGATLADGANPLSNAWLASADLLDPEILSDPGLDAGEERYLLLLLLEKAEAEFDYEVTVCPAADPAHMNEASLDPAAADRTRWRLRGRPPVAAAALLTPQPAGPVAAAAAPVDPLPGPAAPQDAPVGRRLGGLWAFRPVWRPGGFRSGRISAPQSGRGGGWHRSGATFPPIRPQGGSPLALAGGRRRLRLLRIALLCGFPKWRSHCLRATGDAAAMIDIYFAVTLLYGLETISRIKALPCMEAGTSLMPSSAGILHASSCRTRPETGAGTPLWD